MGIEPTFFLFAELINPRGPMDWEFTYADPETKPGDYYYVRVEQLDSTRAWTSPVWVTSHSK